jgi:hypothetical protein
LHSSELTPTLPQAVSERRSAQRHKDTVLFVKA